MPIGTVYRAPARAPPPRKRSSTGLGTLSGEAGPTSPTSPSLPVVGGGPSDLEARIAQVSLSTVPVAPPLSPPRRANSMSAASPIATALSPRLVGSSSGALPPKQPLSPVPVYRQSSPRPNSSSPAPPPQEQQMLRSRPVSAPAPAVPPAQAPPVHAPPPPMRAPPAPAPAPHAVHASSPTVAAAASAHGTSVAPPPVTAGKILILYYSMYGHVRLLADSIRIGVESVPGCSAEIYRVPETLGADVLEKMNAPDKHSDPELRYDMLHKLREADGIMFGIPTRFGMMPAQMKSLFDSTVKLWTKGDLVGKPAGLFFSSATQGGGQETTALTTITQLVHHGMIYVPPGYSFGGAMFDNSEVHGGSPYGCGTIANGDGSRLPSKYELDFAKHQGAQFALVALKLAQ